MALSAPSKTNKYYISTKWKQYPGPGYNKCEMYVNGSCLPNCVGYAYGRFMEMAGITECKLSRDDAKKWYPHTSDGYSRGMKPRVGAVVCWATRGQYGHVAIVEKVYEDDSILISESAWLGDDVVYDPSNSRHWKTQKVDCKNYTYPRCYNFQGFIYNPYLENADSTRNPGHDFAVLAQTTDYSDNSTPVTQLHTISSMLGLPTVSSSGYSCSDLMNASLAEQLGTTVSPYSRDVAQEGDILMLCYCPTNKVNPIDALAVVTDVLLLQVKAVLWGAQSSDNNQNTKSSILLGYKDNRIVGVYRPNFGNYGNILSGKSAALREFASINSVSEPSINISSGVRLSIINYEAAYNFIQAISGADPEKVTEYVITQMMSVPRTVIEYLTYFSYTMQASVAICANMYCDSQLDASHITYSSTNQPKAWGLCQWTGVRGFALTRLPDWNAISVQLQFLMTEISTNILFVKLLLQGKSTTNLTEYTKLFATTYYDKTPKDIDLRVQAASKLWELIKEIVI